MRLPPVYSGHNTADAGDAGRKPDRSKRQNGRLKVLARKELQALSHQALD
jgi:hypothetical protein